MWQSLDPYRCLIDCGPVQMSLLAERQGQPLGKRLWSKTEELVVEHLRVLRRLLPDAKKPWPELEGRGRWPKILELMLEAVRMAGDAKLTPMAAVAGSFAWVVREYLVARGATKVLVNNGGDIALYLGKGATTRVGIVPRLGASPTHYLEVKAGDGIGGVATSGFGGRSFTLGIADAAVAMAATAPLADALATVLGNAVNVDHPRIRRRPARELDPASDLGETLVTTWVGSLPAAVKEEALERGYEKAMELYKKDLLKGAVLFLGGMMRQVPQGLVQKI